MHIILINHYAGSPSHGMEFRPYYLAREWVRDGHEVSVVAASFSHLHTNHPKTKDVVTVEEIDGIRYVWLKTSGYSGNGLARVLNMLFFAWLLYVKNNKILGNRPVHAVVASSPHPFIICGALRMAKAAGAKLIFEVRDLWPLTLIELGNISKSHPFIWMMQRVENLSYKVADKVVSLLPQAKSYMIEHGMHEGKFAYIPNGIDVQEWQQALVPMPSIHASAIEELRSNNRFIIGYAGNHGISNALQFLIEAAMILTTHPVTIVLVGQGPEKESLQKFARDKGLDNVVFLPPIPKAAIPTLLASMDALYIGWNRDPLYRFGVSPNKLMDYMMSAKPVVHSIEAGNDSVAESGCGFSVPPEDPAAIADAIVRLMGVDEHERKAMGVMGRNYVLTNHDYKVLAQKFLALF